MNHVLIHNHISCTGRPIRISGKEGLSPQMMTLCHISEKSLQSEINLTSTNEADLRLGLSDCKCKSPLVLQLRMKMCRDKNILCSDILVSSQYDSLIGNQTSLQILTLFLS